MPSSSSIDNANQQQPVSLSASQLTLPDVCLVLLHDGGETGNYVGAVKRGETGYYKTTYPCRTIDEARLLIADVHERLGVTELQAACMHHGSLFGFDTPGADPKLYSKLLAERAHRADASVIA